MPFTSFAVRNLETNSAPSRVVSLYFKSRLELIERFRDYNFLCPDCKSRFCVKKSQGGRVFFSHLGDRETPCSWGERSTAEHSECIILLAEELTKRGIAENRLIPERSFGKERRADLCLTDKDGKPVIVFEIQLSRMDDQEFLARTEFYHQKNIDCIWLFKKNGLATKRLQILCKKKFGYLYPLFREDKSGTLSLTSCIESIWNDRIGDPDNSRYWNHYHFVNWKTENIEEEQEALSSPTPKPDPLLTLGTYTPSTSGKLYRVNSYGQTFAICKPLGKLETALGTFYHFESVDPEFPDWKGYKFYCFRREDFTQIT